MNATRIANLLPFLLHFLGPVLGAGAVAATNQTDWWSLQPLVKPRVPATGHRRLAVPNPIDAFIFSKLDEQKLASSPEADRRTLIRRATFDLIGLPPTPEEVAAFEKDKSRDAYERLVERLLASPRHGERWARHWLDVVRFAESHGFEMNQPRPNAWPYRDYVIRAFNEDKPYDQFVREQIVGDALGADEATGFMVGGSWDQVKSPDPVLTANQRADELHDMVSTTGSAFLGLTVGCARCHNHKFDPVPQTDYYAMKAVFEGLQHGERKVKMADSAAREQELASRRARLTEVELLLEQCEPLANPLAPDTNSLRAPVNARKNIERFAPVAAKRLRFTIAKTTDAEPCLDELEVYSAGPEGQNLALASHGTKAAASSVYPNSDLHRIEHLNDGRLGNGRSWISNERGQGWVELEFSEVRTLGRIIWGRDREQRYTDRLAVDYRIEVASGSNDWRVIASSVDRQPYVAGGRSKSSMNLAGLSASQADAAKKLMAERAEHEARIAELTKSAMVYGGMFNAKPEPTHRLHRGDAMQKREEVSPGALGLVPVVFTLADPSHSPVSSRPKLTQDQQRRLALADWIAHPSNPLTARVLVNHIWQHHFGEGLVSTPSDFGANGARPSHPELLDRLAAEYNGAARRLTDVHGEVLTDILA